MAASVTVSPFSLRNDYPVFAVFLSYELSYGEINADEKKYYSGNFSGQVFYLFRYVEDF